MDTAADWDDEGQPFRYSKDIVPKAPDTHPDYPAVISVQGIDARNEARQLGELLLFLRSSGVIAGHDQAVLPLLLHSVKDAVSGPYPDGRLDAVGIPALCEAAGHVGVPAHGEMLVTAIHQTKGRKWDAVVGSLSGPDLHTDRVGRNLAKCYGLYPGEQAGRIANLDRIRRRYVAFTRARNLLVLNTGDQPQGQVQPHLGGCCPLAMCGPGLPGTPAGRDCRGGDTAGGQPGATNTGGVKPTLRTIAECGRRPGLT